jgi:hypothetical protein
MNLLFHLISGLIVICDIIANYQFFLTHSRHIFFPLYFTSDRRQPFLLPRDEGMIYGHIQHSSFLNPSFSGVFQELPGIFSAYLMPNL